MKKIFLLISIGALTLLPVSVLAAQIIDGGAGKVECPPGQICIENPLEAESFEELLNTIVTFISWIATIAIAPLMIMIAAFYLLTAGGDPKRIDTARRIILWTVIGLAIILFAKGLISVLKQIIGVSPPSL